MSVRLRIFLAFTLLLTLGVGLTLRWTITGLRPQPLKATEEALVDMAHVLAALVEGDVREGRIDPSILRRTLDTALTRSFEAQIYELQKRQLAVRVYVTDDAGRVLYDSDGGRDEGRDYSRWRDVSRTLRGQYGARATRTDPQDFYSSVLHIAAPIRSGDKIVGVLTVAKPVDALKLFILTATRNILLAGLVALVLAALVSFGVASWLTRPIERLTAHALAIRAGRRPTLPRLGPREMQTLGQAFEEMRDALEGKRYVEGYVRTLTHEIKGPLSAIRAAGELLEEDLPAEQRRLFLGNIRRECERMQLMIDRLLDLSALEARKGLGEAQPLDLREIVREVAASARPIAEQRGIRLAGAPVTSDAPASAPLPPVRGDAFLIRQALYNLVQNAVDFSPDGATVSIGIEGAADHVDVTVRDAGPGVPGYALPRVFERFYSAARPPHAPAGTGLGLAFVREVALLHGGEATLVNHPEGGALATLRLAA